MSKHLDTVLRKAVDEGLLAAAHAGFEDQHRPWPVIVMTAIAAWFAAIPLGVLVGLMFLSGANVYGTALVLGLVFLGVSVAILHKETIPLFLEQLAIPGLIIGTVLFVVGLGNTGFASNDQALAMAIAAPMLFGLAFLLPQAWLRVLLGAAGSSLAAMALAGMFHFERGLLDLSYPQAWKCLAAVWLLGQLVLARLERTPQDAGKAAALETVLTGMGGMTLLALAYCAGPTFLLGASLTSGFDGSSGAYLPGRFDALLSVACALGAAAWMMHRWPALRSAAFAALGATGVVLCWLTPSLGAVLLMLAVCVSTGRRNLAVLAAASGLWMVGALYYYLYWPLAYKALFLLGCGLALGVIARFAMPGGPSLLVPGIDPLTAPLTEPLTEPLPLLHPAPATERRADPRWKRGLLAGAGLLALVIVNAAIWQKEALIRTGQPVFVELAPVDPRSLMQGDYMVLNYVFPSDLDMHDKARTRLVARRAPNGVVALLEEHDGRPLGPQEMLIETISKRGRPLIVTDAWYFKEGEAKRWAAARYGEFRVDANGKALLVGLRGPKLEKL